MHAAADVSPWIARFMPLIRPGGRVLDVACGAGRHVAALAAQGFEVTGVDRDPAALALAAQRAGPGARLVQADLEGAPWPLAGERYDAIVVTNYLWRPLWPALRTALADGGVVLHETFAQGQQTVGRPSRPEFLLQPGELLAAWAGLKVVAYEDGMLDDPPRFVQRIAAVAVPAGADPPPRHPL